MRRYAPVLIAAATGALLLAPALAHAAGIPYFGPIIPNLTCPSSSGGGSYQISPLAWGALITVINNIISVVLTIAIIFFAPLMIAYAGFLYVTDAANPGSRSKANEILSNTIIGLVIALAAWIIVDMVMGALYNGSAGSWYSIITSGTGDPCLSVAKSLSSVTLNNGQNATVTGTGSDNGTLYSFGQGGACNAQLISQQDPGISSLQANQLACIAQGESTCGATNASNYNENTVCWNSDCGLAAGKSASGNASTAAGPYQVLLSSNSSCYNNAICEQAAGTPGQALNCSAAFDKNGFVTNQTLANTCAKAAANIGCSAAAATCAINSNKNGFAGAYATDKYVSSCVNPQPSGS